MPVWSPNFQWVLNSPTHGGMAQAEYTWVPGSAWFSFDALAFHGSVQKFQEVSTLRARVCLLEGPIIF